jgi:hypothetical protein
MKEYITIDNNNLKLELKRNENTNTLKGASLILEDEKDKKRTKKWFYFSKEYNEYILGRIHTDTIIIKHFT